MMGIDSRLYTILAVAVIMSTLVVATIFRADKPEEIAILRNKKPEMFIKEAAQKGVESSFSFSCISGREMGQMELRFSVLAEKEPIYDPDWVPGEETSAAETANHIVTLVSILSTMERLGAEPPIIQRAMEVNGTEYDAAIYDFSRILELFCSSRRGLSKSISVFAVLKKGEEVRYFEGRTGFFLDQVNSLDYLTVRRGENRSEYVGDELEDSPFGILRYSDFPKDEEISVIFEVQVEVDAIPEIPLGVTDRLVLQMIQGYADGDLSMFVLNGMPVGLVIA